MTQDSRAGPVRALAAVPLAVAALLALPGCSDAGRAAAVPDVASYEVSKRDLRVTVNEKGTLKARRQLLVRSEIPGQAKIVSLVEEGTSVEEGDEVCRLDDTQVVSQIEDLENRVIALEGEVTAKEADLEIQISQNEADIDDAKLQLRFAKVELERFEEGEFVQERKKRETQVEETTSRLERATVKYERMPALLEEGFVTADQVEEERIAKVTAQADLELAKLDLETYLKYTAPMRLEERKADVRNAQLEVGRTQKRADARVAQKRANVERQKSELDNVRERLEERRGVLENMVVRAPGRGIVIYGDARRPWDDREIKVGENVYAKQAFMTLPDLSEMQVVVAIHEADISRMKVGQQAFVSVETLGDRTLDGKVTRVAPVPNSQRRRWSEDTKRFDVEISLEGDLSSLKLKPGLTSRVEILVEELKDVLAVPAQSVFAESGKFYVFRKQDGRAKRVAVEIGPGNSQYVVIEKGLSEGDQVSLYNPERAAEGQASAPSASESSGNGRGKNGRP